MCGWGALAGLAQLSRSAGRPLLWVAGEPPEGTGTVGMGRLVGTPLSSTGNPLHRACVVFVGVHENAAPPGTAGLSAAGRRPEGGDSAAHLPGTRRCPCSLASWHFPPSEILFKNFWKLSHFYVLK